MPQELAAASRAGRGLLRWQMRDLARAAGVSLPTVFKMESGGNIAPETAEKIAAAFLSHGVDLISESGRVGAEADITSPGFKPNPQKTRQGS